MSERRACARRVLDWKKAGRQPYQSLWQYRQHSYPKEKRYKSDICKNWKGILIGYSQDIAKHVQAWAPKTQQILVISNPYIDKSVQGAKLLINYPLDLGRQATTLKRKSPTGEPRPWGRPQKVITVPAGNLTPPPAESGNPEDPAKAGGHPDESVEKIMSITETSSKVHEPKTYEQAISDPIHTRQ